MSTQWLIDLGLGIARSGGWTEPAQAEPEIREVVREVVKEIMLPPTVEIREVEVIREVQLPPPPPEIREAIREVVKEIPIPAEAPKIVPCHDIPQRVIEVAVKAVREQQAKNAELDGETKRAAVYRVLLNCFPGVRKRTLSLAIEEALCLES